MDKIILSKDSWHYKLAYSAKGHAFWSWEYNICTYSRFVFQGFLKVLAKYLFFGFTGAISVAGIFHWLNEYFNWIAGSDGLKAAGFVLVVFGLVAVMIAFILVFLYVWAKVSEFFDPYDKPYKLSFITERYRAWKEKSCARIDFQ